ncbi:MAG: hypothetical protein ACI9FB_004425 [Candidatus Azotimanducaceae bacterium]|jgi:hypothetical protein
MRPQCDTYLSIGRKSGFKLVFEIEGLEKRKIPKRDGSNSLSLFFDLMTDIQYLVEIDFAQ